MISFHVTRQQRESIVRILKRAEEKGWLAPHERMSNIMDLSACIAQGCPLDLDAMEREIDSKHSTSVAHDLGGISRHIDRDDNSPTGGHLLNCFRPRMVKHERVTA